MLLEKIKNKVRRKLIHFQSLKLDRKTPVVRSLKHVHLGSENGGWFVPEFFLRAEISKIIYSVGAGEDISFDVDLARHSNMNVFVCDPTPRAVKHFQALIKNTSENNKTAINNSRQDFYQVTTGELSRIHFLEIGIWSKNCEQKFYEPQNQSHVSHSIVNLQNTDRYFTATCKTIPTLMQELGHSKVDLLKIDIEGAEYEVLRSLVKERSFPGILCVEFDEMHSPMDIGYAHRILKIISELQSCGYQITFKDRCNFTFCHLEVLPQ